MPTGRKKHYPTTVTQWRRDKGRVKAAFHILQDETVQEMLSAVDNSSPLNGDVLAFGAHISEGDHSRHLGRIEGFNMYRKALESLAVLQELPKQPKANYLPPEE